MGIREKGLKLPLRVDFAITGNCNLRCKHCSAASTWEIDKSKELSTEEIKGTFRYFSEIGIFKIFLFGGEPFFHPDICEILEYASGFKFQFTTSTNGTLLTRDFVKFLKELGIFKRVQVSLDGPNA